MKAPQCGSSWAGIFMHSYYLDRIFQSNTLELVLHVEFNSKKKWYWNKMFLFWPLSSVYFLKCEYRIQKRFSIVVITQPCVAVELRDTFSSYIDPCGSWQLRGEFWFILANGCTEVLGGLCQSCWSCDSSCVRLHSSLGVCLWSDHYRAPV